MTETGLASVDISVNDDVQPSYGVPSGVCAVIGFTKFGEVGVPTLIETPEQFISKFGGVTVDGDFAHSCLIALEAGSKLLVSRLVHYTVASGIWTPTGAKSSVVLLDADSDPYVTVSAKSDVPADTTYAVQILQHPSYQDSVRVFAISYNDLATNIVAVVTMKKVVTPADLLYLNQKLIILEFSETSQLIVNVNSFDLTGGSVVGQPVAVDYIGSKAARTGVFSFDEYSKFDYVAAFGIAQNSIDIALSNYVVERGDCQAILRTPFSLTGSAVAAYRNAIAPYAGTAVNTFAARMTTGGIKVASKLNSSAIVEMSESPLYVAALCRKNATGQVWRSAGSASYRYLDRVFGVSQNFLASGRATEAKLVVDNGVIPIVMESRGKVRIFGDSTMQQSSGFLRNANVADTVCYIRNGLKEIFDKYLFEPNDIPTWRLIHIEAINFLKPIVDGGGIRAYRYKGDQDANSFDSLTVNDADSIADGIYKVVLEIYPTSVMKYIKIDINLTANLTTSVSVSV